MFQQFFSFVIQFSRCNFIGGAKRDRTADLLLARQALSQLSYGPIQIPSKLNKWFSRLALKAPHSDNLYPVIIVTGYFLRKEVIQPHLPIRLPCYDFTPIIYPTFDG